MTDRHVNDVHGTTASGAPSVRHGRVTDLVSVERIARSGLSRAHRMLIPVASPVRPLVSS
jgi:hypothetical protein